MGRFSWEKIRERVQALPSQKRGIFGLSGIITAIIMIGIFVITLIILGSLDDIVRWLAGEMNIGQLLIHIPPLAGYPGGPAQGATVGEGVLVASDVAGRLYSLFQAVGSALMVIAFVVIGMSFVFEQFKVLQEGTAQKLLSESVLVLILLFIFPWFFNMGAVALNSIDKDMIMNVEKGQLLDGGERCGDVHRLGCGPVPDSDTDYQKMVGEVAEAAGTVVSGFQMTTLPSLPLGEIPDPSAIITSLITASVTFMALFTAFAVGAFKIIATAALAAAFPLILVLRLIPPVRQLSQQLTNAVIGVMMASLVGALFFRIGWEIIYLGGFSEHSGMRWVLGVGTLFAAAGAMTITTRALYGITRMLSGAAGRGAAATVGGMVASAGAAATGGAASAAGAGKAVSGSGMGGKQMAGTVGRAGMKGMGQGAMRGNVGGAVSGGHATGQQHAIQKLGEAGPEAGQGSQTMNQGGEGAMQEASTVQSMQESGALTDSQMNDLASEGESGIRAIENGNVSREDSARFLANANRARGAREGAPTDAEIQGIQEQNTHSERMSGMKEAHNRLKQDPNVSERQEKATMGALMRGSLSDEGKGSTIPEQAGGGGPSSGGGGFDTSTQDTLEGHAGGEPEPEGGEEERRNYGVLGNMNWGGERRSGGS